MKHFICRVCKKVMSLCGAELNYASGVYHCPNCGAEIRQSKDEVTNH